MHPIKNKICGNSFSGGIYNKVYKEVSDHTSNYIVWKQIDKHMWNDLSHHIDMNILKHLMMDIRIMYKKEHIDETNS